MTVSSEPNALSPYSWFNIITLLRLLVMMSYVVLEGVFWKHSEIAAMECFNVMFVTSDSLIIVGQFNSWLQTFTSS